MCILPVCTLPTSGKDTMCDIVFISVHEFVSLSEICVGNSKPFLYIFKFSIFHGIVIGLMYTWHYIFLRDRT